MNRLPPHIENLQGLVGQARAADEENASGDLPPRSRFRSGVPEGLRRAARAQTGASASSSKSAPERKSSTRVGRATAFPSSERICEFSRPSGVKEINSKNILPESQFRYVPLKSLPGKVVWLNWDMLEKMDPTLKSHGRSMSGDIEKEVLSRYCKMIDTSANSRDDWEKKEVGYADQYRGMREDSGSGRNCILKSGEILKGVGATGLGPKIPDHVNGCVSIAEAIREAVSGELFTHLSEEKNKSNRVLAIISPEVSWNQPGLDPQPVIVVRVGMNIRPAHFTSGLGFYPNDVDKEKLKECSDKIFEKGYSWLSNDDFLRDHARTVTMLSRWRMLHGSINENNMTLDGTLLDFDTVTSLPHTAPVFTLPYNNVAMAAWQYSAAGETALFGGEHKAIPLNLKEFTDIKQWKNIYTEEKNLQTFRSLGLPTEAAKDILTNDPKNSALLAKHIRFIGKPYYASHSSDGVADWNNAVSASFADQRELIKKLPTIFFDPVSGEKKEVHQESFSNQLKVFEQTLRWGSGDSHSFYWWRDKKSMATGKYALKSVSDGKKRTEESLSVIKDLYPKLISSIAENGIEKGQWTSRQDFLKNIQSRAARENAPIESFYLPNLNSKIDKTVKLYEVKSKNKENDPTKVSDDKNELFSNISSIIEETISDSKRRVDDLLYGAPAEKSEKPGVYCLQRQTIDNVSYYLEAHDDGSRNLCIEVPEKKNPKLAPAKTYIFPVQPYQYNTVDLGLLIPGLQSGPRKYSYAAPNSYELNKIIDKSGLR